MGAVKGTPVTLHPPCPPTHAFLSFPPKKGGMVLGVKALDWPHGEEGGMALGVKALDWPHSEEGGMALR